MDLYYELADKYMGIRRSLPYIKFDKDVSMKLKQEILILSFLQKHGGIAHPKDLSHEFLVSTARMAVILNQLEEKDFIARVHDNDDNRQTIVRIRPKGEEFFSRCNAEILELTSKLFEKLGSDGAKEFVRLYEKFMKIVADKENGHNSLCP